MQVRGETVILAAGDFPRRGGTAWSLLAAAKRVIACDSAANTYYRHFHKWPDVIIGDLDSFKPPSSLIPHPSSLIRLPDQETNDLEKALRLCEDRGWKNPIVVGATGKREDHTLGNIFRAYAFGVEVVTNKGCFVPVDGCVTLTVKKGSAMSIFAPNPHTRMTSKGLEWPLDEVVFQNLYCATLNRATGERVVLTTTHPVYVYLTEEN